MFDLLLKMVYLFRETCIFIYIYQYIHTLHTFYPILSICVTDQEHGKDQENEEKTPEEDREEGYAGSGAELTDAELTEAKRKEQSAEEVKRFPDRQSLFLYSCLTFCNPENLNNICWIKNKYRQAGEVQKTWMFGLFLMKCKKRLTSHEKR